jgi:hypothetical protein
MVSFINITPFGYMSMGEEESLKLPPNNKIETHFNYITELGTQIEKVPVTYAHK